MPAERRNRTSKTPSRARGPLAVVVLAAGKGTRMAGATEESGPPKVLLDCLGAPLLGHVRRAVAGTSPDRTVVVVGHRRAEVEEWLRRSWPAAKAVVQEPQDGTGHAVRIALEAIPSFEGDVVVVYG